MSERMCGWVLGVLTVCFAAVLCLAGSTEAQCSVLLNECMADPASDWDGDGAYDFRDDEWVEIVATSATDLEGYFLGDETGAFTFGFSGTLGSGQHVVVYGSDAEVWESENGESATGLRLGNSGDTVTLWQVAEGDTVLVDSYSFGDHEAEDDRSSGRLPDGDLEWGLFDALNPYGGGGDPGGTGLHPSPGWANGNNEPSPVVSQTWGRLKTLYRTGSQ